MGGKLQRSCIVSTKCRSDSISGSLECTKLQKMCKKCVEKCVENVHWISIPVHIGDPIGVANGGASNWRSLWWRHVASDV